MKKEEDRPTEEDEDVRFTALVHKDEEKWVGGFEREVIHFFDTFNIGLVLNDLREFDKNVTFLISEKSFEQCDFNDAIYLHYLANNLHQIFGILKRFNSLLSQQSPKKGYLPIPNKQVLTLMAKIQDYFLRMEKGDVSSLRKGDITQRLNAILEIYKQIHANLLEWISNCG